MKKDKNKMKKTICPCAVTISKQNDKQKITKGLNCSS